MEHYLRADRWCDGKNNETCACEAKLLNLNCCLSTNRCLQLYSEQVVVCVCGGGGHVIMLREQKGVGMTLTATAYIHCRFLNPHSAFQKDLTLHMVPRPANDIIDV